MTVRYNHSVFHCDECQMIHDNNFVDKDFLIFHILEYKMHTEMFFVDNECLGSWCIPVNYNCLMQFEEIARVNLVLVCTARPTTRGAPYCDQITIFFEIDLAISS